ncbi:MAG: DUF2490 domain-containing protein [Bacteroidota bacterium]|nr:DUF2490 domain-containing protein [Bacteroidota bacterium]
MRNQINNTGYSLILLVIIAFYSNSTLAQETYVTNDLSLWTGLSVDKEIINDFNLKFEQEMRFYHNITQLDDAISNLELEYSINKAFKLGIELRYTYNKKRDLDLSHEGRYAFHFNYQIEPIKDLEFNYRLKYQQEYNEIDNLDRNNEINTNWRHRLKIQWEKFDKHKIYLSAEYFRGNEQFRAPFHDKYRIILGDKMKAGPGEIGFAIGYEQELEHSFPIKMAILKLNYHFGL